MPAQESERMDRPQEDEDDFNLSEIGSSQLDPHIPIASLTGGGGDGPPPRPGWTIPSSQEKESKVTSSRMESLHKSLIAQTQSMKKSLETKACEAFCLKDCEEEQKRWEARRMRMLARCGKLKVTTYMVHSLFCKLIELCYRKELQKTTAIFLKVRSKVETLWMALRHLLTLLHLNLF